MFPMIPQVLSQSNSSVPMRFPLVKPEPSTPIWNIWTENLLNHRSILQRNESISVKTSKKCVGAVTLSGLSKDARSRAFSEIEIGDRDDKLLIEIDSNGQLISANYDEKFWIRKFNISPDTYSNSALLEITGDHKLCIRMIKNLSQNDEILLWFSEDILAEMNIPFLTPSNIQGKNCYKCIDCGKIYENPNPLKIHIATECERLPIDELWIRLKRALTKYQIDSDRFRQSPNNLFLPAITTSVYPPPTPNFLPNYFHLPSALPTTLPPPQLNDSNNKAIAAAAAQLETIVSNMGSSKQGHVCIYCGKLYSRKYGLKIHIRTHTNYKPLKCKFCYRPFGDPSNLNKHIRLHVQEKSLHKCKVCSKIMVRRRDLIRHMNLKHNNNGNSVIDTLETATSTSSPSRCSNDATSNYSGMSDASSITSTDEDDVEPLEVD